jgi:hypothetical protein
MDLTVTNDNELSLQHPGLSRQPATQRSKHTVALSRKLHATQATSMFFSDPILWQRHGHLCELQGLSSSQTRPRNNSSHICRHCPGPGLRLALASTQRQRLSQPPGPAGKRSSCHHDAKPVADLTMTPRSQLRPCKGPRPARAQGPLLGPQQTLSIAKGVV